MKNIPKLIPVAYFKAYKDDDTLVWGEDCVSATNDFEEADYTGVALVRLSDVAALSEVECENCNQLVRALREAVEGPTFMGEPVFTPTSGAAAQAEPVAARIRRVEPPHQPADFYAWRYVADGTFAYQQGEEVQWLYATPQPPADVSGAGAVSDVVRLQAECDAITELNHAQWLALENVRTLAARNRKEFWAQSLLRFCNEAGNKAQTLRVTPATSDAGRLTDDQIMEIFQHHFPGHDCFQEQIDFARELLGSKA